MCGRFKLIDRGKTEVDVSQCWCSSVLLHNALKLCPNEDFAVYLDYYTSAVIKGFFLWSPLMQPYICMLNFICGQEVGGGGVVGA